MYVLLPEKVCTFYLPIPKRKRMSKFVRKPTAL